MVCSFKIRGEGLQNFISVTTQSYSSNGSELLKIQQLLQTMRIIHRIRNRSPHDLQLMIEVQIVFKGQHLPKSQVVEARVSRLSLQSLRMHFQMNTIRLSRLWNFIWAVWLEQMSYLTSFIKRLAMKLNFLNFSNIFVFLRK